MLLSDTLYHLMITFSNFNDINDMFIYGGNMDTR